MTGQELVAILPHTGELVSLEDAKQCAIALDRIRTLEGQLRMVKRELSEAIFQAASKSGKGTLHLPGVNVSVSRKKEITWDLELLGKLQEMELPEERWNELVETRVDYKVNANVAKQIAAINPEYAKVIDEARTDLYGNPSVGDIEIL